MPEHLYRHTELSLEPRRLAVMADGTQRLNGRLRDITYAADDKLGDLPWSDQLIVLDESIGMTRQLLHVQPEPRRETGCVFNPDRSGLPVSDGHLVPIEEHLDNAPGRIFPGIVWRGLPHGSGPSVPHVRGTHRRSPSAPSTVREVPTPPAPQTRHRRSGPGRGPAAASPAAQRSPRRAHPPAGPDRPSAAQAESRPQPGSWRAPCKQYLPMTAVPATRSSRPELEDCSQVLSGKYGILESGGR